MTHKITTWTLEGFVEHFGFVHTKMHDHKFVWVLGAGASLSSGIPLGSTLVDQWLAELHLKEDGAKSDIRTWANAQNLGIKGFSYKNRASFYSRVYERRFRTYPDEGFAYLESVMSRKDPSPGYSILGCALAAEPARHNAVVTTNFDNLVVDALSIYTDVFPFVCGHESLTSFVRVAMRRPLICKIHRDLLMAPQNDPRSLTRLRDAWGMALSALFQHYTPLVIGYGGNDDTLMDLLESLEPGEIKGQLIWCYYEGGNPSDRVCQIVAAHNGALVPVPDFDLLMVMLGEKMGIQLVDEEIGRRSQARTTQYRDRIQRLDTVSHPAVTKALAAIFDRSGGWFAWYQKARLETDPKRRDIVFRQGLQLYPKSGELHCNYGNFLMHMLGDLDAAELHYRQAANLAPNNAQITNNLGSFLSLARGKHADAEALYRKAAELAPDHPGIIANYAGLLLTLQRLTEASAQLERAKSLNADKSSQTAAEIALYGAILARLTEKDDAPALEGLRSVLSKDFERGPWNFTPVLEAAHKKLAENDFALYSAYAAAILDASKVGDAEVLFARRAQIPVSSNGDMGSKVPMPSASSNLAT